MSYIRQSKKREDDSASSPEAQRTKCEALITAKGWDNAGHFADVGKSGWDPGVVRPAFEEMMAAVRAGHVDAVVVFSLSRLTRQGALEAMLINNELAKHGVLLVSVEEPYLDTSTPMGVAIFGLIAALAQQESDMKSASEERQRYAKWHLAQGVAPRRRATPRRFLAQPRAPAHALAHFKYVTATTYERRSTDEGFRLVVIITRGGLRGRRTPRRWPRYYGRRPPPRPPEAGRRYLR